jgi:phosphoglycolate phosphatase-like HAD superfamily hydrolase
MKKRSRVTRLAKFVLRGGRRRVGPAGPLQNPPRYVLFDFDGTLADTFSAGVEILNVLAEEFRFRPLPPEEVSLARDLSTRGLMKHLGIPRMKLPHISKRGTEEIGKRIDSIAPLPEMPELVRKLHAQGFRLGILTSNSEANVNAFLKNHDLEIFDFVKSSSKLLGKASVLRRLMRELHLKPRQIFFVGDELRDIEAAQETGVHIAAVTWGYNSTPALTEAAPDYLFTNPSEISDLLETMPIKVDVGDK